MTIYTNTFEGGTAGTAITAANSATSGTALFSLTPTGAWLYSTAAAIDGTLGAERTLTSAQGYMVFQDPAPVASGRGVMRRSFEVETTPTGNLFIGSIRDGADVLMGSIVLRSDRTMCLTAGTSTTPVGASSSGVLDIGAKVFVELAVTPGSTTGRVDLGIWNAATGALIHSYSTADAMNTGTGTPTNYRFGTFSNSTGYTRDRMDSVRFGSLALGWAGPIDLFTAPTGLTATPISSSRIDLAWTAVPTATSYDIEINGSIAVTGNATTTYSHTGLPAGASRTYRVRAVK